MGNRTSDSALHQTTPLSHSPKNASRDKSPSRGLVQGGQGSALPKSGARGCPGKWFSFVFFLVVHPQNRDKSEIIITNLNFTDFKEAGQPKIAENTRACALGGDLGPNKAAKCARGMGRGCLCLVVSWRGLWWTVAGCMSGFGGFGGRSGGRRGRVAQSTRCSMGSALTSSKMGFIGRRYHHSKARDVESSAVRFLGRVGVVVFNTGQIKGNHDRTPFCHDCPG